MNARGALAAAAAILLGAAFWSLHDVRTGEGEGARVAAVVQRPAATLPVGRAAGGAPPGKPQVAPGNAAADALAVPGPLPASLRGTREDGALGVDADGRFVPTPDALDLFDYYLSATGEEPDERLHARIRAAIAAHLEGEAALAAGQLLDAYLDYRVRAAALFGRDHRGLETERRLQQIRELRREVFGAEVAEALFGAEHERWFVELERQRVSNDPELDASERQRQLAALELEAPAEVQLAERAARSHEALRRQERELIEAGAGASEIDALREERFGAEAANRLAALDAERAHWNARVSAYRAERDEQLAQVAPAERDALIEAIRARHFEANEQVRIRALDRLEESASR